MGLREKWLSGTGGRPPATKPLPFLLTRPPYPATVRPAGLSKKLIEASERLDRQHAALPPCLPATDGTWPHGPAWSASEISTYQARYEAFMGGGLNAHESETLADQSITRDRQNDARGSIKSFTFTKVIS